MFRVTPLCAPLLVLDDVYLRSHQGTKGREPPLPEVFSGRALQVARSSGICSSDGFRRSGESSPLILTASVLTVGVETPAAGRLAVCDAVETCCSREDGLSNFVEIDKDAIRSAIFVAKCREALRAGEFCTAFADGFP